MLLTIRIYSSEKYRAIINYLILADIASREMQSMQELVFYFAKTQCIWSMQHMFLSLEFWMAKMFIFFYPSFVFWFLLFFFRNMCVLLSTFHWDMIGQCNKAASRWQVMFRLKCVSEFDQSMLIWFQFKKFSASIVKKKLFTALERLVTLLTFIAQETVKCTFKTHTIPCTIVNKIKSVCCCLGTVT